ncbi:MAG TPA: tRNA (adenosine(37)-N6)-dimethylallyltransferase MiaA [Candidatus Hydrogenedens sp.]|nr:tRNA (adenosine(37)-N6)-dimethylallyltransferase MiaA [Candidatus Hydrogenedens sp.]HOL20882.1 tRNA (adenosine(37)-N6)-dimethylallyltransferase MiaA [Candidatus Hydrogenedens sp.]HPP58653.1 tRNA (adenosine(37)-N6)-dimethylallyltransferase MiaA [Candidatus Hydrogenedens sp.]
MDAIAIVGPTASGKTDFAVRLAEKLNTEIISADSMQFYKGMEIGTAVPPIEIRNKIPHHFIAFVPPNYEMNAGIFQQLARKEIIRLKGEGKIPILVGGSGLYLSALIDGLFEGPGRSEKIRKKIREELLYKGAEALFNKLKGVDPTYATRLTSPNDIVRVIRALEVYELTGIPFSEWHRKHFEKAKPLYVLQLAIQWERELLYERINHRVEKMIKEGWIQEVEQLLNEGYEHDIYRLKALGYREIVNYLKGEQNLKEAIEHTKQHHRRYAKKQLTWFRADKRIVWYQMNKTLKEEDLLNWAVQQVDQFYNNNSFYKEQPCFLFRHY